MRRALYVLAVLAGCGGSDGPSKTTADAAPTPVVQADAGAMTPMSVGNFDSMPMMVPVTPGPDASPAQPGPDVGSEIKADAQQGADTAAPVVPPADTAPPPKLDSAVVEQPDTAPAPKLDAAPEMKLDAAVILPPPPECARTLDCPANAYCQLSTRKCVVPTAIMRWTFRNACTGGATAVRIFDRDNALVWPAGSANNFYIVDPGTTQFTDIACIPGAQICNGAWDTQGRTWGVGINGTNGCPDCCHACVNGVLPTIHLTCN